MRRAKMTEVNYYDFRVQLQRATDRGCRIERGDGDKWKEYIRDNDIKEVAAVSIGNAQFEKVKPVVINCNGSWDGFYVYSEDAEAVLKWQHEADG
ncbi:MAG: hypothetical protein OEZ68_18075 [Gammaproteobacteria bacterium]|nr:hypothetical protein [Gammaproteobacteria bacterium]MDH5802713.1 hypothetical protein [Gammaproteobacteria bacterium]